MLELRATSQEQLPQLQHKRVQAVEERLTLLLDQIFSQNTPDDVMVSIGRLEIDLGALDIEDFEKQLLAKVQKKLPAAIGEEVDAAIHDARKQRIIPLPSAKRKAIQHYLRYGYVAWWMPKSSKETIETIYLALLKESPEALKKLWWELKHLPNALKRSVTQFSSATVKKTITLLNSGHARTIMAMGEDLLGMQQKGKLFAMEAPIFAQSVWAAMLSQAAEANVVFNEQSFAQASLSKLAASLKMGFPAFVFTIAKHLEHTPTNHTYQSNLPILVPLLQEELATRFPHTLQTASVPKLVKRLHALLAKGEQAHRQAHVTGIGKHQRPQIGAQRLTAEGNDHCRQQEGCHDHNQGHPEHLLDDGTGNSGPGHGRHHQTGCAHTHHQAGHHIRIVGHLNLFPDKTH